MSKRFTAGEVYRYSQGGFRVEIFLVLETFVGVDDIGQVRAFMLDAAGDPRTLTMVFNFDVGSRYAELSKKLVR